MAEVQQLVWVFNPASGQYEYCHTVTGVGQSSGTVNPNLAR